MKEGEKMLKKLLREIDRLEQSKAKKVEQIKVLQDEVNKIDEEEHIKMWVNAKDIDNNRLNVPSITELVKDAKAIKQMLIELLKELEYEPKLDKEDFEPDICDEY